MHVVALQRTELSSIYTHTARNLQSSFLSTESNKISKLRAAVYVHYHKERKRSKQGRCPAQRREGGRIKLAVEKGSKGHAAPPKPRRRKEGSREAGSQFSPLNLNYM